MSTTYRIEVRASNVYLDAAENSATLRRKLKKCNPDARCSITVNDIEVMYGTVNHCIHHLDVAVEYGHFSLANGQQIPV